VVHAAHARPEGLAVVAAYVHHRGEGQRELRAVSAAVESQHVVLYAMGCVDMPGRVRHEEVLVNIVLGSAFRNSSGHHMQRYFGQVDQLVSHLRMLGWNLRLIAVEGDSVDQTRKDLQTFATAVGVPIQIVVRNHGGPEYGSTEAPERMKALSYVGNGILENVREDDDVLVYAESDLLWRPQVVSKLVDKLKPREVDVVSPMPFAGQAFYDIWAFRKNGHRFGPFFPFHGELSFDGLTTMDSVGSFLVMRGEVARNCRIIDDEALVGFCRDVWAKGFTIKCDAGERVFHP
jgi:hypothetical protein